MQYPATLSPGAVDFISRCLVRAPEKRASVAELLGHPWLRGLADRAAAAPHARVRALARSEVGAAGGGSGSSGGGWAAPSGVVGGVAQGTASAGPASLSLPGDAAGGGGGGGGGEAGEATGLLRVQSTGAGSLGSKAAGMCAAAAAARGLFAGSGGGGCEGHNSSCPNIPAAAMGAVGHGAAGSAMGSAPLPGMDCAGPVNMPFQQQQQQQQQQGDEEMTVAG